MLRRVFTYIGITIIFLVIISYFTLAEILNKKSKDLILCNNINVSILDKDINRFVDSTDVISFLTSSEVQPLGRKLTDINISDLENLLNQKSAIKQSQVSLNRDGILNVSIIQRRPMLRIQTKDGGFYIDEEGYLFPLSSTFTSYVPIISGHVPLELTANQRGNLDYEEEEWIKSILKFGKYIDKSEFWNSQIQQIFIESNKEATLFTRVGDHTIKFGDLDRIEYKFMKLDTFYQNIIPNSGWNKFSTIDISYSDQIICKLRD